MDSNTTTRTPRLNSNSRTILALHKTLIAIFAGIYELELEQQTPLAPRNRAEFYLCSKKGDFSCTRGILLNNKDTLSTVIIRLDHQIVPSVDFALFKDFQNLQQLWVMKDPNYGQEEKPELQNLLNLPRTLQCLAISNININVEDMEIFCKSSGTDTRLLERLCLRDCGVLGGSNLRSILHLQSLTKICIKSIDISANDEFFEIVKSVGLDFTYKRWLPLHHKQEIEIYWARENANSLWKKQRLWYQNS